MSNASVEINIPSPHPGQARIAAHPAKYKIVRCGRRFGKTVWGIAEAVQCVANGGKVGWFAPNSKYSLEAWRKFVKMLRAAVDATGGRVSEQEKRIELPNGGYIEVFSVHDNDDPARGRDFDLVVIDEAGLIGSLFALWQSAIEPTLVDRDGKALFLGTPKGARTPFNVMFSEAEHGTDPDWAAFQGATIDNTTIKGIVAKIEKRRARAERNGTMALFLQEYYGIPADDGSNPIGLNAIREAVSAASVRETVAYGVDLARSRDYTVVLGFDPYGRWTEFHRFQMDWGATKKKLMELCGTSTPVVMDATGVGSPIVSDLAYAGMNVTPFIFSRKSRGLLIEDLVTAFHGKRLTIPDGVLRAELESLGVEYNSETNFVRYQVPDGMTDDGIMALALAWRCYTYDALTPEWGAPPTFGDWVANIDGEQTSTDADDAFAALGDGW